jgi:hypothetical protein
LENFSKSCEFCREQQLSNFLETVQLASSLVFPEVPRKRIHWCDQWLQKDIVFPLPDEPLLETLAYWLFLAIDFVKSVA